MRAVPFGKGWLSIDRFSPSANVVMIAVIDNAISSETGMTRPLDSIRVLELGQLIAGPFAGRMLAEFGADVIKVEPPGVGDPLRKWRLLYDGTSD